MGTPGRVVRRRPAQYADLNGDGKADLIFQGLDNRFWVSLSSGTGFTTPALWVLQGGSFVEGQRSTPISTATAKPISSFRDSITDSGSHSHPVPALQLR